MVNRLLKSKGPFRFYSKFFFWLTLGGFISLLLAIIPVIIIHVIYERNISLILLVFAVCLFSGLLSLFSFSMLSEIRNKPMMLNPKKRKAWYENDRERWEQDPRLIKIRPSLEPYFHFTLILATLGSILNITYIILVNISKYFTPISGFTFLIWVGAASIVLSCILSYFLHNFVLLNRIEKIAKK